MEPTLNAGDVVLVDNNAFTTNSPMVGDVVVAIHPRRADIEIVKRVNLVDAQMGCYLESDNRSEADAQDSRTFGFVDVSLVVGKVTGKLSKSD